MLVAELFKNEVWKKYEADELPPLPAPASAVDITGLTPEPEVGDIYDLEAGTFSAPGTGIVEMGRIEITSIAGPGVVHDDVNTESISRAIVNLDLPVTVSAIVPHPDATPPEQTWTTPTKGPRQLMFATTHRLAGSMTVTITFTPTESGKYELGEAEINSDLNGYRFDFAGLEIRALMKTS